MEYTGFIKLDAPEKHRHYLRLKSTIEEKDKRIDTEVPYYTAKEKRKRENEEEGSNRPIVGTAYKGKRRREQISYISDGRDNHLVVYDVDAFTPWFYHTKGYIVRENEGVERYIRVVKFNVFLIILLFLIMGIIVASLIFYKPIADVLRPYLPNPYTADNIVDNLIDNMTQDEIKEMLQNKVDNDKLEMRMNVGPSNTVDDDRYNLMVENTYRNVNNFYVEIYRADNKERIYTSGLLKPGSHLYYGRMKTALPSGKVPCIVYFISLDVKTGEYVGKSALSVTLTNQQ